MQEIFEELIVEFKTMGIKNILKKMIFSFSKENEDLLNKNEDLKNEVKRKS